LGAAASTKPAIHSMSRSVSATPAAIAGDILCAFGPSLAALAAQIRSGLVLALVALIFFLALACRDLHHANSVADRVGGSLLALGTFRSTPLHAHR
jgi:hypothetical protein